MYSSASSKVESETTTTMLAYNRVGEYKNTVNAKTEEVEVMFRDMEPILFRPLSSVRAILVEIYHSLKQFYCRCLIPTQQPTKSQCYSMIIRF